MDITPDLADRLYTVLVQTLGAPDDYRRWSFIHAITEVHVTDYILDSCLGAGAWFDDERSPRVVCLDEAAVRQRMTCDANAVIREITTTIKPAKVIRPIRIRATNTSAKIPVIQVPSLETTAQHLSV